MRDAETVGECIATALAPKKRIGMCPNRIALTAQEKVCIKLIRLRGALVGLKGKLKVGPYIKQTYDAKFFYRMIRPRPNDGCWSVSADWRGKNV